MKPEDYKEQRIILALISGLVGAISGLVVVAMALEGFGLVAVLFFPVVFVVVTLAYGAIGITTSNGLSEMRSWVYGPNGPQWLIRHQITLSAFWPFTHLVLFTWYALSRFIVDWYQLSEEPLRQERYAPRERARTAR